MDIIDRPSIPALNELLVYIQPAHIQLREGRAMDSQERDVARAKLIRDTVTNTAETEEG